MATLTWTKVEGNYTNINSANVHNLSIVRKNTKHFNLMHGSDLACTGTLTACQAFAQQIEDGTLVRNAEGNYVTPEVAKPAKAKRVRKAKPEVTPAADPVEAFHNAEPAAVEVNAAEVKADKQVAATIDPVEVFIGKTTPAPKGYRLRERQVGDLKPIFQGGTVASESVQVSPGVDTLNAESVIRAIELAIDDRESRGLWMTNEAILAWAGKLKPWLGAVAGRRGYTLAEQDLFMAVVKECVKHRHEPAEWSSDARTAQLMQQQASTTPAAKTETVVAGKKVAVETTTGKKGGKRFSVFGEIKVTAVLRWMGANGWNKQQAGEALKQLGLEVAQATINTQIYAGKKGEGNGHGPVPVLNKEQVATLDALKA